MADLTAFFRAEAEQGGASDPDLQARQLDLVFDDAGARARAGIQADTLAVRGRGSVHSPLIGDTRPGVRRRDARGRRLDAEER